MAIRFTRRARPILAVLGLGATLVAAPAIAAAAPAAIHRAPITKPVTPNGAPSVTQVQRQLGQLALRNTQLVEKYDQAQVAVGKRDVAARTARARAVAAAAAYVSARNQFVQIIQAQYESGSFGAASALLDSNSGSNYLDRLQTLNMVSTHTAQVVGDVGQTNAAATVAAKQAQIALAAARAQRNQLAVQKRTVSAQIKKYQSLLATLTSAQRVDYQRAANPAVSVPTRYTAAPTNAAPTRAAPASGAARTAVEFALAQVGKPYVFGAAGPSSYDCSGLTMAAWARAGVNLPHSAADQYNYGQHVSVGQLQPGDLIFFYQPIGHVTIYIGNGLMVSAPTEGQNVSVVPLSAFTSDYAGATRLT